MLTSKMQNSMDLIRDDNVGPIEAAGRNSKFPADNEQPAAYTESTPLLPTLSTSRLLLSKMNHLNPGEKRMFSPSPSPTNRRGTSVPPPSPFTNDNASTSGYGTNRRSSADVTSESPSPEQEDHEPVGQPREDSWRLSAKISPTLVLENSGSVARDHLASERTFLAYVRTSLAIASTGVALVQLFTISASSATSASNTDTLTRPRIQVYARPLGAATVIMGLLVLCIGILRYFTIQNALTKGEFPVARVTIAFIALVLSTLTAVVFGILVGVKR